MSDGIFHANSFGASVVILAPTTIGAAGGVLTSNGDGTSVWAPPGGLDLGADYAWTGNHSWTLNIVAPSINSVPITAAGPGTNFLADDGTYKPVAGGSGVAKGTPFALNELTAVSDPAGDGEIISSGITVLAVSGHLSDTGNPHQTSWANLLGKPATFPPEAHNHDASEIVSGTFANARIAESNVTQHEAALTIGWAQITGKPATFPVDLTANYSWTGNHDWTQPITASALTSRTAEDLSLRRAGTEKLALKTSEAVFIDKAVAPAFDSPVGLDNVLQRGGANRLTLGLTDCTFAINVAAPGFNGVALTMGGAGNLFLADDGTYKAVSGTGEANTQSNQGGFAEIGLPKSGVDLPLRTLRSSDASVIITQEAQAINLQATGAGGGEANRGENVGGFAGWYVGMNGVNLQFRTLQSSDSSVVVTQNANDINVTASAASVGADPAGTATAAVSAHDADGGAHSGHFTATNNPHSTTFVGLTDSPANYTGAASQLVRVNGTANGVEFVDGTTLYDPAGTAAAEVAAHDAFSGAHGGHFTATNNPHSTSIANIDAGTLAQLNAAITDATLDDVSGQRDPTAHTHPWSEITATPTTLAGYGITDGATDAELAAHAAEVNGVHGLVNTGGGTLFLSDDGSYKAASGGGLAAVVDDPTPQLGGDLDANNNHVYFQHTPLTGDAQTVDLTSGNHATLDISTATGTVAVTVTPPTGESAGTLIVSQGVTARDLTWAVTGGTVIWLGTEPTWNADTSKKRIVSWRWDQNNLELLLIATPTN